jgi:hypothetical protein
MQVTTYKIGNNTVRIHDPAETAEAKARRQERIEKACKRFFSRVDYPLDRSCERVSV